MEPKLFVVVRTEGEYAYLREEGGDGETDEVFVALSLLPPSTDVGTRLRYSFLSYELAD